jgi:hypothetical protein
LSRDTDSPRAHRTSIEPAAILADFVLLDLTAIGKACIPVHQQAGVTSVSVPELFSRAPLDGCTNFSLGHAYIVKLEISMWSVSLHFSPDIVIMLAVAA